MNIKIRLSILAAALAVILAPAHATTIDPSNYDHSITIRPSSGKVTTTLSNFPLLVRLSATRQPWFNPADCGTNGADLRFALADGTLLSHEIDTWSTVGESAVWVNVPSLSSVTEIKVYWGVKDSTLAPAVTAADAWPDYVAVYHLGEGNATAYDSSGNNYTAVNAKAVTAGADPIVGGCASFHDMFVTTPAVTDLTASTAAKPLTDRSRVTFSAWVTLDSFNTDNNTYGQNSRIEIARKFDASQRGKGGFACRYFANYSYPYTANPMFGFFMDYGTGSSTTENWNTEHAPVCYQTWVHLTCTVNGATVAKYVNGELVADASSANPRTLSHGILGPDTITLDFGAADNSNDCQAYARMDEMRIRNGAVSAAWAAADYAQQTQTDFLVFDGESAGVFAVSPIPDQIVFAAEVQAGVTPQVAVTNLDENVGLVLDTDYAVAYSNNTASGTAYAIVTGRGNYAAYSVVVPFQIVAIAQYYIVGGNTAEGNNSSTISGAGSSTGWSTTRGGTRSAAGITAEKAIYYVWTDRWNRTPNVDFHTPQSSKIVVDPGCTWELADKMMEKTLALNNLSVGTGGILKISPANDGNGVFNNTLSGSCDLAEGATLQLSASKDANSAKQYTLNATVAGRGAILMPSTSTANAYSGTLANKIAGDMTGFTGDIETWNGYNAVSLELVYAVSLPGDPLPEEIAYVVVTNGATLKIDQDWVSPTNRIWILGDLGKPTIEVPSGTTVTISGNLVGSVGFTKTGAGTLVLTGESPDFSGEITISAGILRLSGKAATLSGSSDVTITESGGTLDIESLTISPIPAQTVYSLEDLAAGIQPTLVVSNLDAGVELVLGTDYSVAYSNNTTSGAATAIVTGKNDYEGVVRTSDFIIHAIKMITASANLDGDEDWTGFESISLVSAGVTLDLKGHKLTITGLDGLGSITDSVGGGELIFRVPASYTSGYEAKIENVSLTGKLKLVKEGPGVLTAIKTQQSFTGGTVIDGGILRYGCTDTNIDNMYPFGAKSADSPITINPGGVLDPHGSVGWGNHYVVFNGGAVSNTYPAGGITYGVFNPHQIVNADFTFATLRPYGWAVGELDGHTATVYIAMSNATLFIQSHPTEPPTSGCLNVGGSGYLSTFAPNFNRPTQFQNVDLLCNAALQLQDTASLPFRDYAANNPNNNSTGNAALNVYGTFTPNSSYFYGPVMQNGSAIDLSAKTGAWSVTSSLTSGNKTTTFASGATIKLELGQRDFAKGEKVISWTTQPDATFTNKEWKLESRSDGLYVVNRVGTGTVIVIF